MQPFVGRGQLGDLHTAGHHDLLLEQQAIVERHHQGRGARLEQQIEPRLAAILFDHALDHIGPGADFDIARHREREPRGGGRGKLEIQRLQRRGRFLRHDDLQLQAMPALPFNEQRGLAPFGQAQGGGLVVQAGGE